MKQSRLKSWAMWAGIAGAVWLIPSALGVPEKMHPLQIHNVLIELI